VGKAPGEYCRVGGKAMLKGAIRALRCGRQNVLDIPANVLKKGKGPPPGKSGRFPRGPEESGPGLAFPYLMEDRI